MKRLVYTTRANGSKYGVEYDLDIPEQAALFRHYLEEWATTDKYICTIINDI